MKKYNLVLWRKYNMLMIKQITRDQRQCALGGDDQRRMWQQPHTYTTSKKTKNRTTETTKQLQKRKKSMLKIKLKHICVHLLYNYTVRRPAGSWSPLHWHRQTDYVCLYSFNFKLYKYLQFFFFSFPFWLEALTK